MALPEWLVEEVLNIRRRHGIFSTDSEKADQAFLKKYSEEDIPLNFHIFKAEMEKIAYEEMPIYKVLGEKTSKTAVIYFHGGGYVNQIARQHFVICDKIACETKAHVFIPDYPLAPKHTVISAYDKLIPFYGYITDNYENIILMGDSAGGGLALGMALVIYDSRIKNPENVIMISPWLNIKSEGFTEEAAKDDAMLSVHGLELCAKAWAGDLPYEDIKLSPIFGDLSSVPPMTIFTGTHDLLNRDAHMLKDRCEKEGIDLSFYEREGLSHEYILTPVKEANEDFEIIKELILKAQEV